MTQVENGPYETVMDARAEKQLLMGRSKDQEQGLYTTSQKAVSPSFRFLLLCCISESELSVGAQPGPTFDALEGTWVWA